MSKFLIGSSTAAHQVEGNNIYSDYWAMEQMECSDFSEPSLEAANHYNMFKEDIEMMKEAGLNAYRFSIEWARIEPENGQFDANEIKHYENVIKTCLENGIEPIVTLFHFSSPKWLIKEGGWENPETIHFFKRYVGKVISSLGRYLHYVCTINEANMGIQIACIAERYEKMFTSQDGAAQIGINFDEMKKNAQNKSAENIKVFGTGNPQTFLSPRTAQGDLIICQCHEAAREEIKKQYPNIKVGITLSLHDIQVQEGGENNALKEWNDEFIHYIPFIKDDDFFGLQNYTRSIIGKDGILPVPKGAKTTKMGYEYYPQALGNVVVRVYSKLHKPILITENGIATDDDIERISFIKEALESLKKARKAGAEVIGYLHWSFLDNFEWQKGYSMRFGLVDVDRNNNYARAKKGSLDFLGSYIE